jgi:DNA-binding GntR family transcriptional regulator
MLTREESRALPPISGAPVIALVRTAFDTEGQPLEVCDTVIAADCYVLSCEGEIPADLVGREASGREDGI